MDPGGHQLDKPVGRRRGRADRRPRCGGVPGAGRVPGDADERAAGGDAVVGGGAGDALGQATARDASDWRAAGWCRALLLGALAMVRPEYLGVAVLLGAVVFWARSGSTGARRWLMRALVLLAGSWSWSRHGRSETRLRWIGRCRSRPAAGRCCSPAPTCPRTGIRKRSGPRWSRGIPNCSRPGDAERLRLEQILARLADAALSGAGNRPGAVADGQGPALGRRQRSSRSSSPASSPRRWPHLVARAAARDARADLGGAALGAGRPRPDRALRPRLASPLGGAGAGDGLPRDHRAQRPPGRLTAPGAGDAAARRRPRRGAARLWLWDQSRKVARVPSQKRSPSSPASM